MGMMIVVLLFCDLDVNYSGPAVDFYYPQVGPSYGRKMIQGYLFASGIHMSGYQLRSSLPVVAPQHHVMRQQDLIVRTNPRLYTAQYFGHRLHIDQNEN